MIIYYNLFFKVEKEILMETAYKSLKCPIKGHENNIITYICLNDTCNMRERLLCTKCAINHGHSKYYVLIEDIMVKNEFEVDN